MASAAAHQWKFKRWRCQWWRCQIIVFRRSDVSGDGISGSSIFHLPLPLVVNLHLIVWLDLNGASAATKASAVDLVAAYENGGSHTITILILCGGSGGSGTGRGDSCGATVWDA